MGDNTKTISLFNPSVSDSSFGQTYISSDSFRFKEESKPISNFNIDKSKETKKDNISSNNLNNSNNPFTNSSLFNFGKEENKQNTKEGEAMNTSLFDRNDKQKQFSFPSSVDNNQNESIKNYLFSKDNSGNNSVFTTTNAKDNKHSHIDKNGVIKNNNKTISQQEKEIPKFQIEKDKDKEKLQNENKGGSIKQGSIPKPEEAKEIPISDAKFDINYINQDLLNDDVYCNKISDLVNDWKKDLDEKYTFYAPYKKRLLKHSSALNSVKDSANVTAKLYNTIQTNVKESLASLKFISKEQKGLIDHLKQLENELSIYNMNQKGNINQHNPKGQIKSIIDQLTHSLSHTGKKIEAICKPYQSGKIQYKEIDSKLSNDLMCKDNQHPMKEILNKIYYEIQSIRKLEQVLAFKVHSIKQ